MLRSDEIKNQLTGLKNQVEQLQKENKIDEALEMINRADQLKIELENALKDEQIIEKKEVINMEMENRVEMIKKEEVMFANFVRKGIVNDMKAGDNAVIIPTSISERIIAKVKELSPLYARATKFTVKGDLVFAKEDAIPTTAYMDEMAEGTSSDATFKTVKLGAFVARALTKVSRSLINQTEFDIVEYVVNAVAKSIAEFLEKELLNGTVDKIEGLSKIEPVEVDELDSKALIDAQVLIPTALQANCEWIINPKDLATIRTLQLHNEYLFNKDLTKEFTYSILGKNVMLSDQCPEGKIFYGDFSGLYVKLANDIEVNVLHEKYADQFAIGVVGFVQLDAKVVESDKIVAIKKRV